MNIRKLSTCLLLVLTIVGLVGCGGNSSKNNISNEDTMKDYKNEIMSNTKVQAWIKNCESDYKSTSCYKSISEVIPELLVTSKDYLMTLLPYKDASKAAECITDEKSQSCLELKLINNSAGTYDLICSAVRVFGSSPYYCYGVVVIENISNTPKNERMHIAMFDVKSRQFNSAVDGNFNFGILPAKFESYFDINLNPEQRQMVYFAVPISNLDTKFGSLHLLGAQDDWRAFRLPLCQKNSGDILNNQPDLEEKVIYENAMLLNSCSFNGIEFVNRKNGLITQ